MNKSPANNNTEAVRRWRARQTKRKKDRLQKSVKRSSNSEFRKRERETNRIRTAEWRCRDPEVKEKEREAIADRRNNEPDLRKKEQDAIAKKRQDSPDFKKKELKEDRERKAKNRQEEWDADMARQANFNTPVITCLEDERNMHFNLYEHNPETAAMMVYWNTGEYHWRDAKLLMRYRSDFRIMQLVCKVERHKKINDKQLESYGQRRNQVNTMLLELKRYNPIFVFYNISWIVWTETISLQFILNEKDAMPQEYIIAVDSEGFSWAESTSKWGRESRLYSDLDQLLDYFETNPLDPEASMDSLEAHYVRTSLWTHSRIDNNKFVPEDVDYLKWFYDEVVDHDKFNNLNEDFLDKALMERKNANPEGILFYGVCWLYDVFPPSRLSLRFIIGKNLKAHTIVICPAGFVYGSKIYPTLYELLKDFEQNPRSVPSFNWKSEREVRRFKFVIQKKPWGTDPLSFS